MTGDAEQETGKDSELWQKEDTAENQDRPQADGAGGYLFDTGNFMLPENTDSLSMADNSSSPDTSMLPGTPDGNGTVYDVVNDASGADITLADRGNGGSDSPNQVSSNASGSQGDQPGNWRYRHRNKHNAVTAGNHNRNRYHAGRTDAVQPHDAVQTGYAIQTGYTVG